MTSKQEIVDLLNDNEPSFSLFEEKIRNKNVIMLLGLTRSGKSTLGNYLIRNQLTSIRERRNIFKIACDNAQGPCIGQGCVSLTTTPGYFELSKDTVIIDAPGFEDNRGDTQDVLNSVFVSQIKSANTIKFIIVSDIADITGDNIGNFVTTLSLLRRFVTNLSTMINSFAVVFTKDSNEYDQGEIAELFAQKILNNHELHADRELIENFVDNQQLIGIFRMPTKLGVITPDDGLTINVDGAIDSCVAAAANDCKIRVALSDVARNIMCEIFTEYTDTTLFEPQVNKIINEHKKYLEVEDYVYASYDGELCDTKTAVSAITVKLDKEVLKDFTFLCEITDSLSRICPEAIDNEFQTKFRVIIHLDKFDLVEERRKEVIINNYKDAITKLNKKINGLIEKIEKEEVLRKTFNFAFKCQAGTAVLAALPALEGAGYCVRNLFSLPSSAIFASTEAVIGTTATVSAGAVGLVAISAAAASAYVLYQQTYGKRYEARKTQDRPLQEPPLQEEQEPLSQEPNK